MIFDRIKPLDAILATAEKKSLHRTLGPVQLTLLGVGAVIGTGIFVLTSEAAQKAGPGMLLSFVVAGFICAVAALCYSELASMVPVSGSAYTYSYAVVGELLAWMVGWALILEYAVGASAVAVGWSNHAVGLINGIADYYNIGHFPAALSDADAFMARMYLFFGAAPSDDLSKAIATGGWVNVPAILVVAFVTWLLVVGTTESARVNAVLVAVKIVALTAFILLTIPVLNAENFKPFMPHRLRQSVQLVGPRRARRGGLDLLCLCRLRRGLDRRGRDQEPAAQCPHRPHRLARHLHHLLSAGRLGCDRRHRRAAGDLGGGRRALARHAADRRPLRRDRRLGCARAVGLLQGGAGPCAAGDPLAVHRPAGRPGGRDRAAFGGADDDVRPDPACSSPWPATACCPRSLHRCIPNSGHRMS